MSLTATCSIEKLVHFRCAAPDCGRWWSIGDAPLDRAYYCPWCGRLHFFCQEVSAIITAPVAHRPAEVEETGM